MPAPTPDELPLDPPALDPLPALTFDGAGELRPLDRYDGPRLAAGQGRRRFHLMIKPGGSACNLACTYCFYLSKATLDEGPGSGRMSEATLERLVREYIGAVTAEEVVFSWQGGEPSLLGLEFFRRAVELQKRYARPGQTVQNDLQTNGTLIDEEWCRFLKQERFLVGLSIDGPKPLHDAYRLARGGQPTFDKVVRAARLLREHDVPFNTLTCVHRLNARRPLDVYRFLRRELGSTHIQLIPIVEHRDFERAGPQQWDPAGFPRVDAPEARPGAPGSIVTEWSVDPEDWGTFLSKVFDEWHNRDLGRVWVNHFETLVAQHLGLPSQCCIYGELCGKGLAVEHDGSLYSCDHYVYPANRVGNVNEGRLADTVFSRPQVRFGYAKSETLPGACRACAYLHDCWGECPKNRMLRDGNGEPGLNYLCRGFQRFFEHALPRIERIVADLRRHPVEPRQRM